MGDGRRWRKVDGNVDCAGSRKLRLPVQRGVHLPHVGCDCPYKAFLGT